MCGASEIIEEDSVMLGRSAGFSVWTRGGLSGRDHIERASVERLEF